MSAILIIDDDAHVRDLWSDVLAEAGFETRVAASAVDGLDIVRRERIDVVITDVLMPDKDGIEALIEIKRLSPASKVVVTTGGGAALSMCFLEVAHKFGADATLPKPVDVNRLCGTVATLAQRTWREQARHEPNN